MKHGKRKAKSSLHIIHILGRSLPAWCAFSLQHLSSLRMADPKHRCRLLNTIKQMAALNPNDVVHLPGGLCFHILPLFYNSSVINLVYSQEHERVHRHDNWFITAIRPGPGHCPRTCMRLVQGDSMWWMQAFGGSPHWQGHTFFMWAKEWELDLKESWVWGLTVTCEPPDFGQAQILWVAVPSFVKWRADHITEVLENPGKW